MLDALDYLHTQFEQPIIHRDIKPQNLKLRPNGQIKLLDFGLAKGAAPEMSVVSGSIHGYTPQYAPLEQMRGEGTDARSDLYSLAVTLHHLLTGQEPPKAVVRASETISHRPDPLRPAHELNPQIPAAVSAVLQRAAALDPDERPATAAEMREALRHASQPEPAPNPAQPPGESSEPTTVDPPSAPSTLPDIAPPRSNRWKYAAAGIVLALAVGLVMFLNRDSSAPAKASSESTSLSLAPTPTVADSPTSPASQTAALQSFEEDLGNGVKLGMVAIPGGTFLMGSNDRDNIDSEKPPHQVTISAFAIGKYEVTQAQWKAVMGNNYSRFNWSDSLPVENMSFYDAEKFCRRLSERTGRVYRLPTEAEWEYACRAGSTSKFSFGDDYGKLREYAWFKDNSGDQMSTPQTHPVGQLKPNAFGLYDMHGNVWEWCQDKWHRNYNGAPTDGSAWLIDGVTLPMSGGSWYHAGVGRGGSWYDIGEVCDAATRVSPNPDYPSDWRGFRVVCAAWTK